MAKNKASNAAAAAGALALPKPKAGPAKGKPSPTVVSRPATATAPPKAGSPAAPSAVTPFFTADDLDAINQFNTDLATKLQGIDTNLQNLETDTTYQKTQNDTSAKQNTGAAQDDAAARGIFQSSIKDATLYDIEAQRSLSQKFLDDKLTTARLDAGTQKQILGTAKTTFDNNMLQRETQNAQGVNDSNNSAWAAAMAAWQSANPSSTPPAAPAAPAPAGPGAPAKGVARPTASAPVKGTGSPTVAATKTSAAAAQAFAKNQAKQKKYYG